MSWRVGSSYMKSLEMSPIAVANEFNDGLQQQSCITSMYMCESAGEGTQNKDKELRQLSPNLLEKVCRN